VELEVTDSWHTTHPGAVVGILALGEVDNPRDHADLDRRKAELEEELRVRYGARDRADLKSLPVIQAYGAYYRRFRKTYHVLLQLESVVHKAKHIPRVSPLVEAMFMAELEDLLLTAGHDFDKVTPPLRLDVGDGTTAYTNLMGQENEVKSGDMVIADAAGVLSSIVYGSDRRTAISPATHRVLYTTYAPPGVGDATVGHHLDRILENVQVVAPGATVVARTIVVA
jgi:DNA/RNA-binding domain of Phe-tRNA-synthetase-like protein